MNDQLSGALVADVEDIKTALREISETLDDIRHQLERIADAAEEESED